MKLVIVSGLSGAGKTVALHSLEDMGAYCMDNLPLNLLPAVLGQLDQWESHYSCVAVGMDARNVAAREVNDLPSILEQSGVEHEILFLDAEDDALIKRFSETRRRHPLSQQGKTLAEAIASERKLLEALAARADLLVDTSRLHLHQLRDLIRLRLKLQAGQGLSLMFESFGFKYGVPQDADFVFDVRCLPNPHWDMRLRPLTGRDEAVQCYLGDNPKVQQMRRDIIVFLEAWLPHFEADNRSYLTLAMGCTGGRHRSVYLTEQLAAYFGEQRENVMIRHRELL